MSRRRWRRWSAAVAGLFAALPLVACTGGDDDQPAAGAAGTVRNERAVGPFAGQRWPGDDLPLGSLLYDDSEGLHSVDPASGKVTTIWDHPTALVTSLSVAPGGAEIAVTVALEAETPEEPSSVLYLLRADGSIETVDTARDFGQIYDAAFLRAPRDKERVLRLYWHRSFDEADRRTDAFRADVLTRPVTGGRVEEVRVALRHGESVGGIRGYPGGIGVTLALLRVDSDPTSVEVVSETGGRGDSPTSWTRFAHRANTEAPFTVAWLSPLDYVVVEQAHDDDTGRLRFRHFVRTCEALEGYLLAYEGTDVDDGQTEVVWNVVPLASNELLVLTKNDVARNLQDNSEPLTWSALSVDSGALRPTPVAWERGPWTSVWPDVDPEAPTVSDCERFRERPHRVRTI